MPSPMVFAEMIARQQAGRQRLERTPEPSSITDADDHVAQYDRVMGTKLALAYAAGLRTIHRARPEGNRGHAVDIACGPGHFTLCVARFAGYRQVTGVDLSTPMVEIANRNADKLGLADRVAFKTGDATNLAAIDKNCCDLATFTDAAHHMPDLDTVSGVLREMDRVVRPEGLVFVMDLARLRTQALTERYVHVLGHDYVDRGLPAFLDDFRHSMYAAWTVQEFRGAIPRDGERHWVHIVPRGLPTVQFVLGLPVGRTRPFLRSGCPWTRATHPVPREMRMDWRMMGATIAMAQKTVLAPQGQ